MAPMLLLTLAGCFASPFEGTWLFLADREARASGDCEGDDGTRLTGTSNFWVDIYGTGSGELVVLYSQALVGTASGSELTVGWEGGERSEDYVETQTIDLEATLAGGVMEGTVTEKVTVDSDGDGYVCTTETTFTAERNVSSPSAYPED